MKITDQIPTPKAVEILMNSILDSNKSIEARIEDATLLNVVQTRIDKALDHFQRDYEEYLNFIANKREERAKNENSPDY
tara:strand:+ start:573 stop:809 length:237 start_codon:yes stop_codon:yes gene_type:complete